MNFFTSNCDKYINNDHAHSLTNYPIYYLIRAWNPQCSTAVYIFFFI